MAPSHVALQKWRAPLFDSPTATKWFWNALRLLGVENLNRWGGGGTKDNQIPPNESGI